MVNRRGSNIAGSQFLVGAFVERADYSCDFSFFFKTNELTDFLSFISCCLLTFTNRNRGNPVVTGSSPCLQNQYSERFQYSASVSCAVPCIDWNWKKFPKIIKVLSENAVLTIFSKFMLDLLFRLSVHLKSRKENIISTDRELVGVVKISRTRFLIV